MGKELAHGPHREARDPGRNETRQSGLNDGKNKVTVPTWNAEHYNRPMRSGSVGAFVLSKTVLIFIALSGRAIRDLKSSGGINAIKY